MKYGGNAKVFTRKNAVNILTLVSTVYGRFGSELNRGEQ